MTDNPSRRRILQAISTTGAVTLFGASRAAASSPGVRVVEAGIRYDTPDREDYVRYHVDSRPPYTVATNRNELIVLANASDSLAQEVAGRGLVDEQSIGRGARTPIGGSGKRVRTLPTGLSARMRVSEKLQLTEEHRLPTVTVHWNANGAAATVQGSGRIDLAAGEHRQVELDPETVTVKTATTTDDIVPVEGVPEHKWGPAREYGTVDVTATPVVELVDHGTLSVTEQAPPGAD